MRKMLTIAVALSAAFAVAACGSDNKSSSSTVTGPDVNAKGEGQLDMVNWEGYADPSFVKDFEKATGCNVNSVPAGTSDEMFTKFTSGGGGQYDLVSPSGDASLRLIKSGAVAPLDTSKTKTTTSRPCCTPQPMVRSTSQRRLPTTPASRARSRRRADRWARAQV